MSRITELVTLANRASLNGDLHGLNNNLMLRLLGSPRGNYSQSCQPVTGPLIRNLIVTDAVGPFRVTGLKPAVEVLKRIFVDIKNENPEVYAALGNAGMLCCRFVRGSTSAISNHSWGCAIDLTLDGKLDTRGDGKAQRGLVEIHPIFNRHGFFWGAAFPTEDAMHFEVSRELMLRWYGDGTLSGSPDRPGPDLGDSALADISFGDRGENVRLLQLHLNLALGIDLVEDGIFGAATRAAVIDFQKRHNLPMTGNVDTATHDLLMTN